MTLTDINISITCSLKCIIAFTAKLMPSFTAYYTMAEPREGFKIQRTFPFPSASNKRYALACCTCKSTSYLFKDMQKVGFIMLHPSTSQSASASHKILCH